MDWKVTPPPEALPGGADMVPATGSTEGWSTLFHPGVFIALALLGLGFYLIRRDDKSCPGWILVLVGWAIQIFGMGHLWPSPTALILAGAWALSRWTDKFRWDDYIVYTGVLAGLGASLLLQGALGPNILMTPAWWALTSLWIFWGTRCIREAPGLQARKGVQGLLYTVGWIVLVFT